MKFLIYLKFSLVGAGLFAASFFITKFALSREIERANRAEIEQETECVNAGIADLRELIIPMYQKSEKITDDIYFLNSVLERKKKTSPGTIFFIVPRVPTLKTRNLKGSTNTI